MSSYERVQYAYSKSKLIFWGRTKLGVEYVELTVNCPRADKQMPNPSMHASDGDNGMMIHNTHLISGTGNA